MTAAVRSLLVGAILVQFSLASDFPITKALNEPMHRLARRQAAACSSFVSIQSSCEIATRSFTNLPLSSQVACLCDDDDDFDDAISSCLRYFSTADPDIYSSYSDLPTTLCADYESATRSTRSTITSSASINTNNPQYRGCLSLNSVESSCSSATSNWDSLPVRSQGSCLCYDDDDFEPQTYDAYRQSCLSYYQSADPPFYQSLVQSGGAQTSLCSQIGDVRGQATSTTSSRSTSSTARSTTGNTVVTVTATPTSTSSTGGVGHVDVVGGSASFFAAMGALALAIFL